MRVCWTTVCSFTVIQHRTTAQLQQICCRISRVMHLLWYRNQYV